jgi:hypothetical protein
MMYKAKVAVCSEISLNTKRNLLYISNQRVPRYKHFLPQLLYQPVNDL